MSDPRDPLLRLPGPSPKGERVLWHGQPSAMAFVRHLFRLPLAGFGPDNAGVFAAWLERPVR